MRPKRASGRLVETGRLDLGIGGFLTNFHANGTLNESNVVLVQIVFCQVFHLFWIYRKLSVNESDVHSTGWPEPKVILRPWPKTLQHLLVPICEQYDHDLGRDSEFPRRRQPRTHHPLREKIQSTLARVWGE